MALYGEAIALDPSNCVLYSNRSAANVKLQRFQEALLDANRARDLNPQWPKVSVSVSVSECECECECVSDANCARDLNSQWPKVSVSVWRSVGECL